MIRFFMFQEIIKYEVLIWLVLKLPLWGKDISTVIFFSNKSFSFIDI